MHEYGVTSEQMAKVAVENRRWALDHPHAAMRDKGPITVDDVLASKMIASPLRMLDCAPWLPGGIATAAVIARAETARNLCQKPTYIAGFGQSSLHEWAGERMGLAAILMPLSADALRRGVELLIHSYPEAPASASAWKLPGPFDFGEFKAPVSDWRQLANERE